MKKRTKTIIATLIALLEKKQQEIQNKIDEINQKNKVIDKKNTKINTKEREAE